MHKIPYKPHLSRWCGMWLYEIPTPFNWPIQGCGKTIQEAYLHALSFYKKIGKI